MAGLRLLDQAPRVSRQIAALSASRLIRKMFRGDPSPWSPIPAVRRVIRNRLGWLRSPERMLRELPRIESFAASVRADGIRRVVVLGMGGSSLCVEVFRRVFPPPRGFPEVSVLDGTVPETVRRVEAGIDLAKTLFVVSSKSGTTTETAALQAYFWDKTRRLRVPAGRHFVAITDPGTPLSAEASARGYRAVFHNAPDIGGRFSALSYFGLLPAALGGADVAGLLKGALAMLERCGPAVPASGNPGLILGAALGTLARQGRDKVVLLIDTGLRPLGLWIEQLLAESTGKDGRGLVPVEAPLEAAARAATLRGPDRIAVAIGLSGAGGDARARLLGAIPPGTPSIALSIPGRLELGGAMIQWEIATAVAGAVLVVNPFDEPNVAESKRNTEAALEEFDATGSLSEEPPALVAGRARVFLGGVRLPPRARATLASAVSALLAARRRGDYIAVLAYVDPASRPASAALDRIRALLARATGCVTTLGYGPRYLHSSGQLHKGGPDEGLFLEIAPADPGRLPIPGTPYDFETLKQAQALGDSIALKRRGRRILRLRSEDTTTKTLRELAAALRAALRSARRSGR